LETSNPDTGEQKMGATKTKTKGYKFAKLREEATKKAAGRAPTPEVEPFVLEDVEPPIVITAPDTVERMLVVAEMIGPNGEFHISNALPLLRAMCGDQFGRVWMLVRDDKDPETLLGLLQAMVDHFTKQATLLRDVKEAADLPGDSEGSSD
jgi:hypothetical protein